MLTCLNAFLLTCSDLTSLYWHVWMGFYGPYLGVLTCLNTFLVTCGSLTSAYWPVSTHAYRPYLCSLACLTAFLVSCSGPTVCPASLAKTLYNKIPEAEHWPETRPRGYQIPLEHHRRRALVCGGQHDFIFLFWSKHQKSVQINSGVARGCKPCCRTHR